MTVENIERVYLSPVTEHEAIQALMHNNEFTLVSQNTSYFVFERVNALHFTLEGGDTYDKT